jgi:BlaI family transcriptional regulator, penicillinase repressor
MSLQSNYEHSRLNVIVVDENAQTEAYEAGTASAEALWHKGRAPFERSRETFPKLGRPAYTTVQTVVYRLERKKALRCVKRISNANIFEAVISRKDAQHRFVDELLTVFGGRAKLLMAHLIESGELTLEDVKEAQKALRQSSRKENRNDPH